MLTVSYLGPEKTNTHFAARKRFGVKARYLHAPTVEDVFRMVEREKADFGVVPIENSLEGAVTRTLDRFMDFKNSSARICGEIDLPIQHYLIMDPRASKEKIRVVYSHPQALAQCSRWLEKQLAVDVAHVETSSTTEAVQWLFREDRLIDPRERAAIGRRELASRGHLKAIPIPVTQDNRTRFLVLSLKAPRRGRKNKTSLMFVLKDKPGALHDALVPFKKYRINLTKIESRPTKRKAWEYIFFIDFEGHQSEPRVQRALRALEPCTSTVKVLGSYPIQGGR